ncbi:MAG TPA: class I SAM-dependent methyltransferase [Thalassobaculum sp.]
MSNDTYKREYTREFVSRWDRLIGWNSRAEGENGFFERLLRRHDCREVADIAAGTGFHAIRLADAGFAVTASDGAETMIQQTERNADEMGVALAGTQVADWRELDKAFGANRFDALVCLGNAFTHLFEEDGRQQALEAMRTVLRPGGMLVLDHRNYDKILDRGYSSKHRYYYVGNGVEARPAVIREDLVKFEYAYADGNTFHLSMFPLRRHYMHGLLDRSGFTGVETHGDFESSFEPDEVDFFQQIAFKPRH